jgi:hypothetical protein
MGSTYSKTVQLIYVGSAKDKAISTGGASGSATRGTGFYTKLGAGTIYLSGSISSVGTATSDITTLEVQASFDGST